MRRKQHCPLTDVGNSNTSTQIPLPFWACIYVRFVTWALCIASDKQRP